MHRKCILASAMLHMGKLCEGGFVKLNFFYEFSHPHKILSRMSRIINFRVAKYETFLLECNTSTGVIRKTFLL